MEVGGNESAWSQSTLAANYVINCKKLGVITDANCGINAPCRQAAKAHGDIIFLELKVGQGSVSFKENCLKLRAKLSVTMSPTAKSLTRNT